MYSWYGFPHLEGNKPNCGGNSLSETDGNKKAKKSQQTNKEFDLLPRMLFCDCYLIKRICNIFLSTAGCFPNFALFHAMKHIRLWDKENTLINSKYINIKTRWMKKGLSDGFQLWVLPSFILNLLNEKRIQAFKIVDGRLSKGVIWKLNLFLFTCNQIKWTIKESKIKG